MAAWLAIPFDFRIAFVGVLGLLVGPFVNWAIYNAAYFPRPISPWFRRRFASAVLKDKRLSNLIEASSGWSMAHLPVMGWLALRREGHVFGRGFWIRPLCIELGFPIFLAWLYWYETSGGLLPRLARPPGPAIVLWLHWLFLSHSVLSILMCIATFIDFDERTIPDWITVPGTLLGLVASSLVLTWHLPIDRTHPVTKAWPSLLLYDAPQATSTYQGLSGWIIVVSCFTLWCAALADRRWITRRGVKKAFLYFWVRLFRNPSWKILLAIWLAGVVVLTFAWPWLSLGAQQSLLSSSLGMVIGGLTVWLVRWVSGIALGMEALGFGDVTLMAMVGAFVGWQPAMIAFFVSPMLAIVFVLIRYLITGDNQTPFGPYLCAGVLVTLLAWDRIWNGYFQDMLEVVGPTVFVILGTALMLMGGMLWIWRLVKQTWIAP